MAPRDARICSACSEVLKKPHTVELQKQDDNQYRHHASLDSLMASVQDECPICTWLLMLIYCHDDGSDRRSTLGRAPQLSYRSNVSRLQPRIPSNLSDASRNVPSISTLSTRRWRRGLYLPLPFRKFFPSRSDSYEAEFQIRRLRRSKNRLCVRLEPYPCADQPVSNNVGGSTGSEQTISTAKLWLNRCEAEHQCLLEVDSSWRPDRLIYLYKDLDGSLCARVAEARLDEYAPGIKYATLSHRWLAGDTLRLDTNTASAFRTRIPCADAKTAVREAMEIAIRLEEPYIWIDSLCILQDDKNDLDRQISLMDRIFANSHFTIAAANSNSSEEGCFSDRDPHTIRSYRVEQDVCAGTDDGPSTHILRLDWNEFEDHPRHSILSERAWIYQERFLTPRTLHFCNQQIYWQCREMEASETFPEGMPLGAKQLTHPIASDQMVEPLEPAIEITHAKQLRQTAVEDAMAKIWYSIVEEYSGRFMTVRDDRLRALDGVAAYCREHFRGEDQYWFGIWRSMLPKALCWADGGTRQSDLTAIAPSWSWASMSHRVRFPHRLSRPSAGRQETDLVEVVGLLEQSSGVQSSISTTSDDSFDTPLCRVLHLRGHMLEPAKLRDLYRESNQARSAGLFSSSFDSLNYREYFDEDLTQHEANNFCLPIFCTSAHGCTEEYGLTITSARLAAAPETPMCRRTGTYEMRYNREGGSRNQGEPRDIYLC